jgi:hypothetical protein|tara:strand:+ start:701 stop:925 length:225 start_codon:yes stop_codon:yes gene_type:complete
MENTTEETKWETGDEFLFTESPFTSELTEKQYKAVYTLGERQGYSLGQRFQVALERGTQITVSTRWIKKPEPNE